MASSGRVQVTTVPETSCDSPTGSAWQGDFGTGNTVFINKITNQVTANGRLLIKTLSSLQTDLEDSSKRLQETEACRVALEQEREVLQKDLNDSRAAHNAQVCMNFTSKYHCTHICGFLSFGFLSSGRCGSFTEILSFFSSIFQVQRNIELHKSQRLAEKEAHDLSISLNESEEAAGKLKERVDALILTNTSLTDRISTAETDLEDASRQLENLTAQIATLRHEVLLV